MARGMWDCRPRDRPRARTSCCPDQGAGAGELFFLPGPGLAIGLAVEHPVVDKPGWSSEMTELGDWRVWMMPESSRRCTARRPPGSGLRSRYGSAMLAWQKRRSRTRSSRHLSTGGPTACRRSQREGDELLGLVFACCHPLLPRESQIALTLRVVCGLTTAEIAAAFLVGEPTMAQRLSRARKALRETGAAVRVPDPDQLGDRLDEVLAVIYLVFNEGYLTSAGRTPARRDLAAQAVALNRLLHALMPREPEVLGLLALLLLHESRAATRFDGWGRLVRLADQDRSLWDRALIAEATRLLSRAMPMHRPGPYQIQAAIAAVHAAARRYADTDWRRIRALYDRLLLFEPSPVVRLNRAVATRFVLGPQAALAET